MNTNNIWVNYPSFSEEMNDNTSEEEACLCSFCQWEETENEMCDSCIEINKTDASISDRNIIAHLCYLYPLVII